MGIKEEQRKEIEKTANRLIETGMISIRQGQQLLNSIFQLTITVVSRFYNDEILTPFFLDHYSYADEIIIILDKGTIDGTRELLSRDPKVKIEEVEFPHGYTTRIVTRKKEEVINRITTSWIICVDSDEFIFPTDFIDVREVLSEVKEDVVYANMWQVYRHHSELELDPSLKAVWLRRHGPVERGNGAHGRLDNKPLVFRSGLGLKWDIGHHSYEPNPSVKVSPIVFDGAHWKMADVELAILRRLRGRRENVSIEQVQKRWAFYDFDITEEKIRKECAEHLNDPQLF